jgi:hypothetical protein
MRRRKKRGARARTIELHEKGGKERRREEEKKNKKINYAHFFPIVCACVCVCTNTAPSLLLPPSHESCTSKCEREGEKRTCAQGRGMQHPKRLPAHVFVCVLCVCLVSVTLSKF